MERYLQPPSTAATLNVAANGAQAARIWSTIDKEFSDEVPGGGGARLDGGAGEPGDLRAATAAMGGGAYDDKNVSDEFYWAAASSTSRPARTCTRTFLDKSPYFKKVPTPTGTTTGHAHVDDLGRYPGAGDRSRWRSCRTGCAKADIADIRKTSSSRGRRCTWPGR